jgi:hypothetical protein
MSITLDLSNALKTFFPDYFFSRVTGILLSNSEGGRVYYDNISVISSSSPGELPSFVYYLLADTSVGHFLSAIAGVFGLCYTGMEAIKGIKSRKERKQSGKRKSWMA